MPTGRITMPGGLTTEAIQVPQLPGPRPGIRGNTFGAAGGTRATVSQPSERISYGARTAVKTYAPTSIEVWKANFDVTNQGARASRAARQSLMYAPHNSPSRSQFVEGYTAPMQVFATSNTWQTPAGESSQGVRAKQPSLKFVSPFSRLPIPVKMPWDL